jgi:thymidylate synthase
MNGIPVLTVTGTGLAETWEKSMTHLYNQGCEIATQYDKPSDSLSKDCSMLMVVEEPLSEPMIHRCFPDSKKGLVKYANSLITGINDDKFKDTYTYYRRFFKYDVFSGNFDIMSEQSEILVIDQIDLICKQVAEVPHTRRAQAITWKVWEDATDEHAPCLQSIWCRMTPDYDPSGVIFSDGKGNVKSSIDDPSWCLSMNIRIRSNDAYRAGFMNMYALIRLQEYIAKQISQIRSEPVVLGRYCHWADSYHIYGSTMKDFEDRFLKSLKTRSFKERTWDSSELDKLGYAEEQYKTNF